MTTVVLIEPHSTTGDSHQLCSSPEFPLYAYALSLELPALAIMGELYGKLTSELMYDIMIIIKI